MTAGIIATLVLYVAPAIAQRPKLEQCLAEIGWAEMASKRSLASYTWNQEEAINIEGKLKRTVFRVRMAPNGELSRVEGPRDNSYEQTTYAVIGRIFGKSSADNLVSQINELADSYTYLNPSTLEDLLQRGRVALGSVSFPGEIQLVVQSYLKPGDSLTIVFSRARQAIVSVQVSSYLSDPQDQVTISAQFEQIANGPNHISTLLANRLGKQVSVSLQNSAYQKLVNSE